MLDADAPGKLRDRATENPHVAACADGVVVEAGGVENCRSSIDRPALHEPGGIDRAVRSANVEVAVRLVAQKLAPLEDVAHVLMRILATQPAAVDPTDLAVLLERAEGRVDPAQPVEELVERRAGLVVVADVHDDGQAHDLLDPACAWKRRGLKAGNAHWAAFAQ